MGRGCPAWREFLSIMNQRWKDGVNGMKWKSVMLPAVVAIVSAAAFGQTAVKDVAGVVKVTGGSVQGKPGRDKSIAVFKGIPFAAPPVGDLRWRAPQPVVAWEGVHE